ncbi:MAG TPA: hypothetical protein VK157_07880 [Phycisphaerales bacterium]|nr:hypothetical protein [Phycisphaerales bacterium]
MNTCTRCPRFDVRAGLVALLCILCLAAGVKFGGGDGQTKTTLPFAVPEALAAGVVSQVGGLTVMTTDATNEDLLLVLDGRNEELFVYRTQNNESVQLLQRYPIAQLFVDARARSLGGP